MNRIVEQGKYSLDCCNLFLTLHFSECNQKFCSEYGKRYLRPSFNTMSLMYPNKSHTWEAEIKVRDNEYRLAEGWRQFVNDNELKTGDICLFQLMESKKLTMTVHIIREQELR